MKEKVNKGKRKERKNEWQHKSDRYVGINIGIRHCDTLHD